MKISEEKEHLYRLMQDITAERRKLSEMYFSLKERLDDLNKLEQKGLDELSIKGYIDFYNESQKEQYKNNIKREAEHTIVKLNNEIESVQETQLIPKEVIAEARFNDRGGKGFSEPIEKKKNNPEIKIRKRAKKINMKAVNKIIEGMLKERTEPLRVLDMYPMVLEITKYTEEELKINNFRNNVMKRICASNPRIKKVGKASYHYI